MGSAGSVWTGETAVWNRASACPWWLFRIATRSASDGEQKKYAAYGTAVSSHLRIKRTNRSRDCKDPGGNWFSRRGCELAGQDNRNARPRQDILADLAAVEGDVDIVFASGLTDPSASAGDLALANVERPVGVIEATIDRKRFRYLTIGSVLETSRLRRTIAISPPRPRSGHASKSLRPIRASSTDCASACTHRLRRCAGPPFVPRPDVREPAHGPTFPNEHRPAVARIHACGRLRTVDHCAARPRLGRPAWQSISAPASRSDCLNSHRPCSGRSTASSSFNSARFRRRWGKT